MDVPLTIQGILPYILITLTIILVSIGIYIKQLILLYTHTHTHTHIQTLEIILIINFGNKFDISTTPLFGSTATLQQFK